MASRIGQTVSHYKILERLGAGGMGVVFKADDLRLRRTVALKFLPPELTRDPEADARFLHEAQAASALQHNNIGVVHDIDEASDGARFIVMEYYAGETLKTKIERGTLPLEEVVDLARQIARGLAVAHGHDLVHRDIKPANILITQDGVAKIIDFGLAKLSGLSHLTRHGSTMGTVAYMSPEQSRAMDVDQRTDIWSFGVVLYEMCAGRRPFESVYEQALVYSILHEPPPPLTSFRPNIPKHLLDLCSRCLAKERDARPASMEEVLSMLDGRSGDSPRRGIGPWIGTSKWKWGAVAGIVLVLMALVVLAVILPLNPPQLSAGRTVVGILRFENQTGDTLTASWPTFTQWRLFDDLAGRKNVAVFDPVTADELIDTLMARPGMTRDSALRELFASTPVNLIVDGTLRTSPRGYRIELRTTGSDQKQLPGVVAQEVDEGRLANSVDSLGRTVAALLIPTGFSDVAGSGGEQWHTPKVHPLPAVIAYDLAEKGGHRGDPGSIEFLRNAIQIDWAYIAPRAILITRLVARGSLDEARDHLRVLMTLRNLATPYEQALIDWAKAVAEEKIGEQTRALELLLGYSPGDRLLLYTLARLKYVQNDFHGCIETLQPVLKSGWHYSPMYYLLGGSYEQLGQLAEARRILEESLAFRPVYPEIYGFLSAMCRRDRDSLLAARYENAYLDAGRKGGVPRGNTLASLARLCQERGQDEDAERLFALAVREQPDSPAFREGWGDGLLYTGDTVAAEREYRRTLALDPRFPGALYRLGEIYERRGNRKESLRYTGMYLRVDSTGEHATEARARLKRQKH